MTSVILIAVILLLIVLEIQFQRIVLKVALPIFETKPPFGTERYPTDPSAEPVSIPTTDGLRLQGSLFRTLQAEPRGLILFCHELDSNRWSALAYCEGLLADGYHILAFDFRNHGDSDHMPGYEPMHWLTGFEVDDVLAAVEAVSRRPDLRSQPLGVFGVSRGGGAALAAAACSPAVRCVASDGAFSCNEMLLHFAGRWGRLYFPEWVLRMLPRWHVLTSLWLIRFMSEIRRGCKYANVEKALHNLRGKPLLMISGERDTYVIPGMTRALHAMTGQDESGVWIVPGAKHNMARQSTPDEYDRRLVEFFAHLEAGRREVRRAAETPVTNGQAYAGRSIRSSGTTAG